MEFHGDTCVARLGGLKLIMFNRGISYAHSFTRERIMSWKVVSYLDI